MAVIIKTLESISLQRLLEAFNAAFSDYFIKMQLTEDSLHSKIIAENILLQYSAGVFDEEELVGFILTGIDTIDKNKTAYNAGTGVHPAFRGHGYTKKMYQFLIPLLSKNFVFHHQLEVMLQNHFAIKVYESVGFTRQRRLHCYRGVLNITQYNKDVDILISSIPAESDVRSFWNELPTWQNTTGAIARNKDQHQCVAAFHLNKIVGYAIFVPLTMRIKQFAVSPGMRRKGIGNAIFLNYRR